MNVPVLFSLYNIRLLLYITGQNHYALWLIALLAVIPTILLLALMKGVYRSTRGETAKGDSPDLSKNLPLIVRMIDRPPPP